MFEISKASIDWKRTTNISWSFQVIKTKLNTELQSDLRRVTLSSEGFLNRSDFSSSGHQSDPGDDCSSNNANEYHLLSNQPEYPGNPKASDYTEHPSNRWTPSIRTHILHERPDSSACERRTNESKMGFREMNYGIMNILTGLLVTCRRTGIFTRLCSDSSCSISHNDSIKWWCKPYCFFHRCQISTIKSKFV